MIVQTPEGLRFTRAAGSGLGQSGCRPIAVEVRPPGGDPNARQQKEFNPCVDDPRSMWCHVVPLTPEWEIYRCMGDRLISNYRRRLDNLIDFQRSNIMSWETAWGVFRLITQSARDWLQLRFFPITRSDSKFAVCQTIEALIRTRDEGISRLRSLWLRPYPGEVPAMPDFRLVDCSNLPVEPPPESSPGPGVLDRLAAWLKEKLGIASSIEAIKKTLLWTSLIAGAVLVITLIRSGGRRG